MTDTMPDDAPAELTDGQRAYADVFTQHYAIAMLWASLQTYRRNDDGQVTDYDGNVITDPDNYMGDGEITVSAGDAGVSPYDWQDSGDQWAVAAFDADGQASIRADCDAFVRDNWADLEGLDPEQCGHDFALTRNHHGAGFWDRGLGDVGERLTDACDPYGSSNAWWDGEDSHPVMLEG